MGYTPEAQELIRKHEEEIERMRKELAEERQRVDNLRDTIAGMELDRLNAKDQKPFCYMSETYEVALFDEPPTGEFADMFPVYRHHAPAVPEVESLRQQLSECEREKAAIWESYKDCRTVHYAVTAERDKFKEEANIRRQQTADVALRMRELEAELRDMQSNKEELATLRATIAELEKADPVEKMFQVIGMNVLKEQKYEGGYFISNGDEDRICEMFYKQLRYHFHSSDDEKLRKRIDLYEKALKASWPDGAKGDPFDYWNAARAAEGEK